MNVTVLHAPTEQEWLECKQRALITQGFRNVIHKPDDGWKYDILNERHSPIRVLRWSFRLEDVPSNIATHFCRHKHAEPYVSSLRNDRQDKLDGDNAPRNTPVDMILDVNAEELMTIANKRLCAMASAKTIELMQLIRKEVIHIEPVMRDFLVPMCVYQGGVCHEKYGCGRFPKWKYDTIMRRGQYNTGVDRYGR